MMNGTHVESKVVVIVTLDTDYIKDMGSWEGHMPDLGITAYGQSKDEAIQNTKKLFAYTVRAYRKIGFLGEWLDQSDVKWDWEPHYSGEREPEDVSVEEVPPRSAHHHQSKKIEIPDDAFGLAA